MSKSSITEWDIIFISYDEPNAEENWANLLQICPWAKRVDKVKGLDACHKAAANLSETDRFLSVDGDCKVDPRFFDIQMNFQDEKFKETTLSWAGQNHTNGLIYGNGGLKLWWKQNVLDMRTHEHPDRKEEEKVDFCWHQNYIQMYDCYSTTYINGSPFQAWKSGFREGVKLSLDQGKKVDPEKFQASIWPLNYKRLLVWASVGTDVEYGEWTMLGTRMGILKTNLTDWNFGEISDYDWMKSYFEEEVYPEWWPQSVGLKAAHFSDRLYDLGNHLRKEMGIQVAELSSNESKFFKTVSEGQRRRGASITED